MKKFTFTLSLALLANTTFAAELSINEAMKQQTTESELKAALTPELITQLKNPQFFGDPKDYFKDAILYSIGEVDKKGKVLPETLNILAAPYNKQLQQIFQFNSTKESIKPDNLKYTTMNGLVDVYSVTYITQKGIKFKNTTSLTRLSTDKPIFPLLAGNSFDITLRYTSKLSSSGKKDVDLSMKQKAACKVNDAIQASTLNPAYKGKAIALSCEITTDNPNATPAFDEIYYFEEYKLFTTALPLIPAKGKYVITGLRRQPTDITSSKDAEF